MPWWDLAQPSKVTNLCFPVLRDKMVSQKSRDNSCKLPGGTIQSGRIPLGIQTRDQELLKRSSHSSIIADTAMINHSGSQNRVSGLISELNNSAGNLKKPMVQRTQPGMTFSLLN